MRLSYLRALQRLAPDHPHPLQQGGTMPDSPVAELVADVITAKTNAEVAYANARPLERAHGRARAELIGAMLRGLVDGDPLEQWLELVASALSYPRPSASHVDAGGAAGAWVDVAATAIGQDVTTWIRFTYGDAGRVF